MTGKQQQFHVTTNLKDLDNAFFRFLGDLNYLRKLINLGLRPRLIKHFVGNLNHVETSKHCLTYIY